MKPLLLILSLLFNLSSSAKGIYKLHFNPKDYSVNVVNGIVNIQSSSTTATYDDDENEPALPYTIHRILRPLEVSSKGYMVSYETTLLYDNVKMEANKRVLSTNTVLEQKDTLRTIAKHSNLSPIEFLGDMSQYGFSYASFKITPFIYNAEKHQLYFVNEISITMPNENRKIENRIGKDYTKGGMNINFNKPNANFISYIKEIVENPHELDEFYSGLNTEIGAYTQESRDMNSSTVEYLVVTSNYLAPYFTDLVNWKTKKGVPAQIITIEDIQSDYTYLYNISPTLAIKYVLSNYYQNHGLKWVLLGGDMGVVPSPMCKIDAHFGGSNHTDFTPCDYYYACFDGAFNWDGNGNGVLGETTDGVNLSPYLYVSRVPVWSPTEVTCFVDKVLQYEKSPQNKNYVRKMLLAGCIDPASDDPRTEYFGKSAAHQISEQMYQDYINISWIGSRDYLYDTGSSSIYSYTFSNLVNSMESGYHFLHMFCHGERSSWEVVDANGTHDLSINPYTAYLLNNTDPLIILTTACITSAFDSINCLGYGFIRGQHGAIVYVGSSREGFWQGRYVTLSPKYNAVFFQKLFGGQPSVAPHRLGSVMAETKKTFIDLCNSNTNGYRWLQYSINPFGDPEMPIYTGFSAMGMYPDFICNGSDITVSVGNFDNCTFVMESTDGSRYEIAKNVYDSHTFQNVTSPVRFTITRDGHCAYESDVIYPIGNDALIGNTVLCDSSIYYINNLPENAVVSWYLTGSPYGIIKRDNYPQQNRCMLINDDPWSYNGKLEATITLDGDDIAVLEKNIVRNNGINVSWTQFENSPYPRIDGVAASTVTANYVNPECTIFVYSWNFRKMNISYSGVTPLSWDHTNDDYLTFSLPTSSVGQTFTIHVRAAVGDGVCNNFDIPFIATTSSLSPQNNLQLSVNSNRGGKTIHITGNTEKDTTRSLNWNLSVYDATTGKIVLNRMISGDSEYIDTSIWSSGVYIIKCQSGETVLTGKMTVAK